MDDVQTGSPGVGDGDSRSRKPWAEWPACGNGGAPRMSQTPPCTGLTFGHSRGSSDWLMFPLVHSDSLDPCICYQSRQHPIRRTTPIIESMNTQKRLMARLAGYSGKIHLPERSRARPVDLAADMNIASSSALMS